MIVIQKLATYYLLFSIIASVLYIPVYTHTCHLFNEQDVSLYATDICCSSCPEDETIKMSCCSNQLEVFSLEEERIATELVKFELFKSLISLITPVFVVPESKSHLARTSYPDDIPKRSSNVSDFLFSIQVFRL